MKNTTWEKILGLIIASREAKNISKTELANLIGTSVEFVSQMECGKKKPSIDTLIKIANALDMNFF